MIRYCDKCRKPHWNKTEDSYMGNFKCQVCGEITYCHTGGDHLKSQVEKAREEHERNRNISAEDDSNPGNETDRPDTEADKGKKPNHPKRVGKPKRSTSKDDSGQEDKSEHVAAKSSVRTKVRVEQLPKDRRRLSSGKRERAGLGGEGAIDNQDSGSSTALDNSGGGEEGTESETDGFPPGKHLLRAAPTRSKPRYLKRHKT